MFKARMNSGRVPQRGEFLLSRALALLAVLALLLALALWVVKGRSDKRAAVQKAEEAQSAGTTSVPGTSGAAATGVAEPRPIGFGLTFALAPSDDKSPPDVANLSCHGEPRTLDRPHKDSCNPYQGDTSCRIVLPVLCLKPEGAAKPAGVQDGFYQGWTGGTLAATQPVMGAILESEVAASARCTTELGPGWRMAEFHDGNGGWGLQGQKGKGFLFNSRYWVHINDQRGNCWDSPP